MEVKDLAALIGAMIGIGTLSWTVFQATKRDRTEVKKQEETRTDAQEERTLKYAFELMDELKDEINRLRQTHKDCETTIARLEERVNKDREHIRALEDWCRRQGASFNLKEINGD